METNWSGAVQFRFLEASGSSFAEVRSCGVLHTTEVFEYPPSQTSYFGTLIRRRSPVIRVGPGNAGNGGYGKQPVVENQRWNAEQAAIAAVSAA